MGFNFLSNRRLHDKNTKAVPIAIDRIKTVAPIVQERYHNAFIVNGFPCLVYTKLETGIKCSCTIGREESPIQPILDESGNAPENVLQSLLADSDFRVDDYGIKPNNNKNPIKSIIIDSQNTERKEYDPSHEIDNPLSTEVEADINDTFLSMQSDFRSTRRCGICYGSGYVGGYSLHNGNRFVLSTTTNNFELHGTTIDQTTHPHSFSRNTHDAYVEFTLTLPWGALSVDSIQVYNNVEKLKNPILTIKDIGGEFKELTPAMIMTYTKGIPIVVRISNFEEFTHLEIQFNMTKNPTYLEYPKFTKTGDLNVLDSTSAVQIIVSGLIYKIDAWDIIVDLHDRNRIRYWRVTDSTNFQDRNAAVYGWEVNARLIQPYEIFCNLPSRNQKHIGQELTTKLPRF